MEIINSNLIALFNPWINMKSVFEYLEYRDYLKEYYEFQKERNNFFSFRYMSIKTGMDASFLVKVLQKNMHISNKNIPKLIDFLKLDKKEAEYFELLVSFNKAKKISEIKLYFEKLLSYRSPHVKTLLSEQYEFFNSWYTTALYELLTFYPYKGQISELAQKLIPAISASEARRALALLVKLQLVKKNSDGYYKVVNKLITTGERWESIAIRNFQKKMIELSSDAIDRLPKNKRDISTVTLSLSKEQFELMKDRIKSMRKELLEMADREMNAEDVYQINFQIFPLTNLSKGGGQ